MRKRFGFLIFSLLGIGFVSGMVYAQAPAADQPTTQESNILSPEELDELVGRIALYPDELIAITLPASTFPLQIVQASRFLQKKAKNRELKPRKDWDPSILGLLNYPEVIEIMNEDLDWTWKLGEAVVAQQKDVMDAIQQTRLRAHAAGNLESNKQQIIVVEKQIIIIKSADPQVIYVPQYDPRIVVVPQPAPVAIIYSNPYPVYTNPAATFFTGMFVGAAISYGMGWHDNHINYHDGGHGGPVNIDNSKNINVGRGGDKIGGGNRPGTRPGGGRKWTPGKGSGARPGTRPGARPGSRPRADVAKRPGGVGSKPAVQGSRPGTRTGKRPSTSAPASRGKDVRRSGQGAKSSVTGGGKRSGRYSGRRSSRSGAFSGYGRGSRQGSYSNRGRQSRSVSRTPSRGRSASPRSGRGGGASRGGGRRR